jgi:hypothetical protein
MRLMRKLASHQNPCYYSRLWPGLKREPAAPPKNYTSFVSPYSGECHR